MLFAFLCTDKAGALQVRLDTRPEHVDYLKWLNEAVKAETIEEARTRAENDPYAKAGLFETVEVKAWNWVFNNPEA